MTLDPHNPTPAPPGDAAAQPEQRSGGRTAMFVTATYVMGGRAQPVRIRNMSRDGALLEGAVLPPEEAEFDLVRGQLHVRAQSKWTQGNQCGASFSGPVDVAQWMARSAPDHQQRVDALVHEARLAIAANQPPAANAAAEPASTAANIRAAISLIEDLEEALSEDPAVVARHLDRLQSLDRALQLLRVAVGQPA